MAKGAERDENARAPLWPGLAALAAATVDLGALLAAESQALIISLLAFGIVAVLAAAWLRLLDRASHSFMDHEDAIGGFAVLAALAVAVFFHEDHFVLLLVITVLLYTVATLGLNIQ